MSKLKRLPPRPDLYWQEDGVPRDQINDDVYFSVSNGLEETREVFFRGCGLVDRWKAMGAGISASNTFTIGELGFGTGLNIAALRQLWREHRPNPQARLEVISFEGRLMRVEDAKTALSVWPELASDVQTLLSLWPVRAKGVQRLCLGFGMSLLIFQDEIEPALKNSAFKADAWFLDGFSPAKNPEMWSSEVMAQIALHSAPECVVGTYTVAGHVRRALAAGGFEVSKQPGFGTKRERMQAIYPTLPKPEIYCDPLLLNTERECPASVIVIGAGIMGACMAQAFHERGCEVTVLDKGEGIEEGASANPLGLVAPRLDGADTPQARLLIDAYLAAIAFYKTQNIGAWPVDTAHFSSSNEEIGRHAKIKDDPPLDTDLLGVLEDEGRQMGLNYLSSMAVSPVDVRSQLLKDINVVWNTEITSIGAVDGAQRCVTAIRDGQVFEYEADLVVIAAGMGIADLAGGEGLPLRGRGGQLEYAQYDGPDFARSKGHYVVGANGKIVFGATYQDSDGKAPEASDEARAENMLALDVLAPELKEEILSGKVQSATAVRAATPDQLPFAGRLPEFAAYRAHYGADLRTGRALKPIDGQGFKALYQRGVYAAGGLGSRGLTWAPFLAQIIVADAFGGPVPTGADSRELIAPARFFMRQLKREKPKKD